jgi:predicted transcriptional regulator YdeE
MKNMSITLEDDLYNHLKHSVPARRISKFVSEAIMDKLNQKQQSLYQAYLEASQDEERESDLQDWDNLNIDSWGIDEDSKPKGNN